MCSTSILGTLTIVVPSVRTCTTRIGARTRETATSAIRSLSHAPGIPNDPFSDGLDLPRGPRARAGSGRPREPYELNGEDARMLATIGAFRVVAERDLEDARDPVADPHDDALEHLRDEGLIRMVDTDAAERAAVLTERGWDVLESRRRDRNDDGQAFHAGLGRARELRHDAELFRE